MNNPIAKLLARYRPEILGVLFCLFISFASGFMTSQSDFSWYDSLIKPSFNPPKYIFGPVWTVLYILMGWALGRLFRARKQHPELLYCFLVQLFFNAIWSFIFFQKHSIFFAMLDLIALWISLTALMIMLKMRDRVLLFTSKDRDKLSFYLLAPYWLWSSFAMILNISLWVLNK